MMDQAFAVLREGTLDVRARTVSDVGVIYGFRPYTGFAFILLEFDVFFGVNL